MESDIKDFAWGNWAQARADLSGCTICLTLWHGLMYPKRRTYVRLGSPKKALSTRCSRHVPLVEAFLERFDTKPEDMDLIVSAWRDVLILACTKYSPDFKPLFILLVNRPPINHFGVGQILDQDWVDLPTIIQHKDECLSTHGDICQNPLKIWPTNPAWLIDTVMLCMVPGNTTSRFVALSYMYGEGISRNYMKVDTTLVRKLQEPNALNLPDISPLIHPIVSRAMKLTRLLGERYLWADALCILHGPDAGTAEQLHLMGAIYASALVTIIAGDGNAEEGLLGLKDVSPSRKLGQNVVQFGQEHMITRDAELYWINTHLPYYSRGWTYQEYVMSPRKINFNEKLVHWECQCSFWGEGLTASLQLTSDVNPILRNVNAGFPDLQRLQRILDQYNKRKFTYEEDVLAGILGLLTVLSRTFVGGFLCGLPEMYFDMCLGWRSGKGLKRRIYSDRPIASRLTPSTLPSWSWIGWKGDIKINDPDTGGVPQEIRCDTKAEIIPVTEWFTGSSPDRSNLRRIRPACFEHRSLFKNCSEPLPPGWTRHKVSSLESFPNKQPAYHEGYDGFLFEHENFSPVGHEDKYWRFPFPVPDVTASTPPCMPEQTPYLFCRTKRAFVCAGGWPPYLWSDINSNIGNLYLDGEEKRGIFWGGKTRHRVEIVAVYRTRVESENRCPDRNQKEPYDGRANTHEILWVEWENGVAYRKASGWVYSAAWEELLHPEDVSLVLG